MSILTSSLLEEANSLYAYFNQLIINPGRDESLCLGDDCEPIEEVRFDNGTAFATLRINRTANVANKSFVRITDRNRHIGN